MSVTDPNETPQDTAQDTPPGASPHDTPPQATADPQEPSGAPTQPENRQDDLAAQIDALKAQLDKLEQRSSSGQLTASPQDEQLAEKVTQLRSDYQGWPSTEDEFKDKPQPWDLKSHGLPQPGVTRDYLPGGQADELSLVVIAHDKPLLTSGMAGEPVHELAMLLANIGYPSSISKGQNPTYAFDESVQAAVNLFKREYHVAEDPSQFPVQHDPELYVGPWLWEALIRANRLAEEQKAA